MSESRNTIDVIVGAGELDLVISESKRSKLSSCRKGDNPKYGKELTHWKALDAGKSCKEGVGQQRMR